LYDDNKRSAASAADSSRLRAVVKACVRSLTPLSPALSETPSDAIKNVTKAEYNKYVTKTLQSSSTGEIIKLYSVISYF